MEEEETSLNPISLSDLLHRSRPVTGATFLPTGHPTPRPKPPPPATPSPSNPQTPKILKPFTHPSPLIGTLTLTTPPSCSNSSCLHFSDHSATVCCDILDFNLRIIGQTIRVLAWNFIPVKPHGGYLEIIRWCFDEIGTTKFNAFYLNSVLPTYEESIIIPRCLVYGILESVSPVTNVPCTANKTGTKNLNGFLAEVTVCECELCSSRDRVMSLDDLIGKHGKDHVFMKSKILYFCGSASVWYSVMSRLVGGTVLISGMKKKMVFLGEGKSLMMYVSTEKAIIHIPMSVTCKNGGNGRNDTVREKGMCSVYTGSVTAMYMQGMVVELDQKVLLLLTDNQLSMPHSLRIGAIVTVRNFHIEDPKFSWTKVTIFGSCYKTSIRVNVFSPIESGCYQVLQSRSLLRKFIESLQFSARLWVLLVVSSFRKKFAGVLSETEILGSKHMEGLVQKYSSSSLPLSVFRFRHGVLSEYCLHDLCGCGKEIDYSYPKLVVPISNLISKCEDMYIKSLYEMNRQYSSIVCGGKSHDQPFRKILKSDDMNIVFLGNLRVSEHSGKLQLNDATGSVDVVIPDLPSVWSVKDIYEINEFDVVMEGFPRNLEHLELLNNDPFACGNIFNHFHFPRRKNININIYIHCYMKDAKSRNHILRPSVDMEENLTELESGLFHLLLLVHKFPVQQKFPGDYVVSNNSSVYAEAIILPWNLAHHNNEIDLIDSYVDKNRCDLSCHREIPCTIDCRVHCEKSTINSGNLLNCTTAAKKVLLEFKSDSFSKFESLRIGGYYLTKHHYNGLVCTAKGSDKVSVGSKSHLWNVSFSADEAGPTIAQSVDIYLHLSPDHLSFFEVKLRELKQDLIIQPINSIKVTSAPTQSGAFGVNLPTGNLLSVQGRVMAVHRSDQIRPFTRAHPRIVPRVSSVCIHVLVDRNIVKISSSLSEHSYPTGFGPGVKANFHRVLLTAGGGVFKLTPASFIEIDSIIIDDDQCSNERDITSVTSVVGTTTSLLTGPAVLISEMTHFSDRKKMRLHCKVVSVYILVMEKTSEFLQSSKVNSCVNFPLAGFIMDDGSSSCCCWADTETAMTLLGSHKWSPHKRTKRSSYKPDKKLEACGYSMSRMSDILNQNGRVVIKNHGSVFDSCLDAAVSVDSDGALKESDEQFLKALILQACCSNTWNVVGSVLDSEALKQIEEQLQRLDMMMKLPFVNIWASEVSHLDTLNEGRKILQQLLKSEC
ncbi:putative CST complex subunit CTC1 protein [Helianthus annuus]|uniref:CST complex subunit CTC1 n=1 Tax=Helianthus annuus TaxID=4232 RepID=A0A251TZC8_HELAN|nr:CST complex subunit CTC1 [Helianthus annuus]KAF5792386.1 putative CST complex subunit CTC1, plant protein [Helianthus annuus]KAJ0527331.1 putative CST complex subunit CTC1 protein [Helianthus annuus]KAJ0536013.1 putative CST complex subunit CTC1 protein [Helianthus annuus]KAJ0543732.1 putative CST complex subunit CTC1 protein [Helianthus annuus]KAJ0708787.1 putative CST complex subunit CTC1 protein [Helianthus annuus]